MSRFPCGNVSARKFQARKKHVAHTLKETIMSRKFQDVTAIVDGVKITTCAYRGPKRSQVTWDINKSRYTPWHTGVVKYEKGTAGILGTVDKVAL